MSKDKNEDTMSTTTESDLESLLGEVVNAMETMVERNEDALNRYHVEHTPREPGRPYIPRLSLKRLTTVDSMNDYLDSAGASIKPRKDENNPGQE